MTHENEAKILAKDFAKKQGISVDALRARWNQNFAETFNRNKLLSAQEQATLSRKTAQRKRVKNKPAVTRNPQREKVQLSLPRIRSLALVGFLVSGALLHSVVIWYDIAFIWGKIGMLAGGMAFILIAVAIMMATDTDKGQTSQIALYIVFLIDTGAYFVHFPAFKQHIRQMAGQQVVSDTVTMALCIAIPAMSFSCLYLLREYKLEQ